MLQFLDIGALCKSKSGIMYEIWSAHLLVIFQHQTNQHPMMSFLAYIGEQVPASQTCRNTIWKSHLFLLPNILAHLWLPSMAVASYAATIVFSWKHPMLMGKNSLNRFWSNPHRLLDNLKTWKGSLSLDSVNSFFCLAASQGKHTLVLFSNRAVPLATLQQYCTVHSQRWTKAVNHILWSIKYALFPM